VAYAHITVWPQQSTMDASELYTVRVPTEKSVPTVAVRVEFPQDVVVSRFVATPGWTKDVTKDSTGRITAVTWTGGQIQPDELGLFLFQARNPKGGQVSFRAIQTYADKSVVEWTGPANDATPAPVVKLTAPPMSPAEVTDAASIANVVTAITLLDNSGFHGMDEAIAGGTIPAGSLGKVQNAYVVAAATKWPVALQPDAQAITARLADYQAALVADNPSAATDPAHDVHELEHALSHKVYDWLANMAGISTQTGAPAAAPAMGAMDTTGH
jgi:uncharacterized protein YcnI